MDTSIPLGVTVNEIVSNSFKYAFSSRDKGEIRIRLRREGNGENRERKLRVVLMFYPSQTMASVYQKTLKLKTSTAWDFNL
jgi:two-component sensor histidine kinase